MFGLGFTEVVILLLLVLLVFGPARLPEIAKDIGKGMRQLRRATKDLDAVPEIREIRKAVEEIRNPVVETLREPILDPDELPPPLRSSRDDARGGEVTADVPSPMFSEEPKAGRTSQEDADSGGSTARAAAAPPSTTATPPKAPAAPPNATATPPKAPSNPASASASPPASSASPPRTPVPPPPPPKGPDPQS